MPHDKRVVGGLGAIVLWLIVLRPGIEATNASGAEAQSSQWISYGILAVAAGVLVWALIGHMAFSRAPIRRVPALVRDERADTVTSRGRTSGRATSRRDHALLCFEDGSREEFQTTAAVAKRIRSGTVGMAVIKAGILVDFHVFRPRKKNG